MSNAAKRCDCLPSYEDVPKMWGCGCISVRGVLRDPCPEHIVELAAREVSRIYEGLRVDANDGEFALWSENDLVVALHRLGDAIREADRG